MGHPMVSEPSSSSDARAARLEVRAGEPLAFVEDPLTGESILEPPPGLRLAAAQVGATLKSYRDTAKTLLNGKYSHLCHYAPNHLREPCNITVICCRNGIIVRYDLGTEGATKIRA